MSAAGGTRAEPRSAPGAAAQCAVVLALLVLAVAGLYAQTARHGFVSFDDGAYLTENPHVNGGLTPANVLWAFTEFHSANWHPLTWLSHQLDWAMFGGRAGGHHLVNAGLHALAACLCFLFLWRASGKAWASALVAFLFAVHPQRVESVAWASERKDVLAGVCFFALLLAYERHVRRPSARGLAAVAAWLAFGLMAKPMLVTVPVVLLVLDLWPFRRLAGLDGPPPAGGPPATRRWSALLLEKWALFALAGASALVTLFAQRSGGAVRTMEQLDLATRVATAVLGFWRYVADALWPTQLCFYYPHPAFVSPDTWVPFALPFWLGLGGLCLLGALAWRLRRRAPAVLAGLLWMGVMLLPVIGLVQVGAQFSADRYAYLPQLGLLVALVFGAEALLPAGLARRLAFAAGAAGALALLPVTYRQVATWRDNVTLTTRALAVTERNYVAHQHLGLEYQRRREFVPAKEQYLAALAIAPSMHDTHSNLGAVFMQLDEPEAALAHYRRALELAPGFLDALLNIGLLLEQEDDLAGARAQFERATVAHPQSFEAWTKLADAELLLGDARKAVDTYRRALSLEPSASDARAGLGEALFEAGEEREARSTLSAASLAQHVRALHAEVRLLAGARDPALRDPVRAAQRLAACPEGAAVGWAHRRAHAALLARQGRFADAARAATEASAAAPRAFWAVLGEETRRYQAGRAPGDPP